MTTSAAIRVLLVEDNLADVRLIQAMTAGMISPQFQITHEPRLYGGLHRLDTETYDLLLLDLGLPDSQGLSTFTRAQAAAQSLPIIVLTGDPDDRMALEAMRSGAQDYLVKGDVDPRMLTRAMRYAIERKQIETENVRLLNQVQSQARQIRQILGSVPEGICVLDAERRIQLMNPRAQQDLQLLAEANGGDILTRLGDHPLEPLLEKPELAQEANITCTCLPGRYFSVAISPLLHHGTTQGWILLLREVTQERERQLHLQGQERLAALGQMAAGIAHDFNNILSIISLYTEILQKNPHSAKNSHYFDHILTQTRNAATLVKQILDFGRRSIMRRTSLDLGRFLGEMQQLLRHTLPESMTIELECAGPLADVSADRTYLEQVIVNMGINARDAMAGRGVLRFVADMVIPGAEGGRWRDELAGKAWVRLRVVDSGNGITPEHLPHIFEPFFSTKSPEQGSGLGLAQVYGIIKQHGGEIEVESQPGVGTTFTIYLPAASPGAPRAETPDVDMTLRGQETILIVEDEAALRGAVAEALASLGYAVLLAEDGQAALELVIAREGQIDLIVSDVVMPRLGGMQLFSILQTLYPALPVILTTGYPLDVRDQESLRREPAIWLYKPYSTKALVRQIRAQLSPGLALASA